MLELPSVGAVRGVAVLGHAMMVDRRSMDKDVRLFDLDTVLAETAALRSATSELAKRRVAMLQAVESVFAL